MTRQTIEITDDMLRLRAKRAALLAEAESADWPKSNRLYQEADSVLMDLGEELLSSMSSAGSEGGAMTVNHKEETP
ncbi:MAG: hypothetical protein AAF531_23795 [Actinomycetota bacterium]